MQHRWQRVRGEHGGRNWPCQRCQRTCEGLPVSVAAWDRSFFLRSMHERCALRT